MTIPVWAQLVYLAAAVCFILALKGLSGPKTARNGNLIGGTGPGEGNVIVNNSANGISSVFGTTHNLFLGNTIYNNGQNPVGFVQLGINLNTGQEPAQNVAWPPGLAGVPRIELPNGCSAK